MANKTKLLLIVLGVILAIRGIAATGQLSKKRILYEKDSPYSTIVVTEDDHGLRTLLFERGGARQSVVKVGDPDHIELPYARGMCVGLAFVASPQRVLVVGLGGGTIPGFLHKHYPQMTIEVVDIDPDVVDVAKKFFGFREDRTMQAHVEDGRRFIEARQNAYDIIFLDAFSSENIPYHLATREFLQAVRRALTPDGVVVSNVWSRASNRLYDSMVRTYQDVFDALYVFDIQGAGNMIFIAGARSHPVAREALTRRAAAISKQRRFPFDMGDVIRFGFRGIEEDSEDAGGRVLTDKKSES